MTGFTLTRRTLEDTGDMAGFAVGPRMHPCQRETGLEVVKALGTRLCLCRRQGYDHQHQGTDQ